MEKPLFVPLNTRPYEAFKDGSKDVEMRLYGPRWNEKTCWFCRPAVLSKGYGKKNRLTAKVSSFMVLFGRQLKPDQQDAVLEIFGTLDKKMALIGFFDIKEQVK